MSTMAKKTGVIVQMRLDSTRLSGKAELPLAGTTLAGAVMRRLSNIPADAYILASDQTGANALGEAAKTFGFTTFAGPKEDVLARYALAIRNYGFDRIIRATGDNPFVSVELACVAIAAADSTGADYVGLVGMPTGMGVEVVTATALLLAEEIASSDFDREHVCPFIYNHPGMFRIYRPECPASHYLPRARLTIDTAGDYRKALAIYATLGDEPSDAKVLAWLRDESKDVIA